MKKIVTILFLLSSLVSCSDTIQENVDVNMFESQSRTTGQDNHVALADVLTFSNAQMLGTRASSGAFSDIECITNDSNDTLLYVVNKQGGGWTIYSSDARVPAIVAQSDEGSFSDLMQNEHAAIWIQSIAEDIQLIKTLDDDALNFTKDEIENNKSFWKSVSAPDDFVKKQLVKNKTKGRGHPGIIDNPDPFIVPIGHYELVHSEVTGYVYDSIPRLTTTDWHQNTHFNDYCPYKSNNIERAPAGCVAIAGAQMLYFLHYHFGIPDEAPSVAYCYGNVTNHPNYNWGQYGYNSTVWDLMPPNSYYNYSQSVYAAPLIADVGRLLNMEYGDDGSSAPESNLENNVFPAYNISCTYSTYNTNNIKSSLSAGIPVILEAYYSASPDNVGHSFITDRYKSVQQIIKNTYFWVWDYIPPLTPLPVVDDKIEYTYSSPTITMIGMNWGWGYNPPNEWYSLTGDWIKGTHNWNIDRHMIYGFQVANNN